MKFTVESQLALLQVLKDAKPNLRKAIIQNADPDLIHAISEICHNYACGNIKCSKLHLEKLKKYKTSVRRLASVQEKSVAKKRKVLLQSGNGFVGILLKPIISELVSYFASNLLK